MSAVRRIRLIVELADGGITEVEGTPTGAVDVNVIPRYDETGGAPRSVEIYLDGKVAPSFFETTGPIRSEQRPPELGAVLTLEVEP